MRPFKDKEKTEQEQREDLLRRKWGSESPKANEAMEQTHRYVLGATRNTDKFKGPLAKYLKEKHEFEKQWRSGALYSWKDYYMGGREMHEKHRKEETNGWQ